jgi:RNA polymerase sigma factor (TIGR02999 family)
MSSGKAASGPSGDVTALLVAWRQGEADAPRELFALVYEELRVLARAQVRRRGPEHSLGATGLVHEAYLKLVDRSRIEVRDRGHFFALAGKAMRQVLVDHARRRGAAKRGGAAVRETLDDDVAPVEMKAAELLALDEALTRLEGVDPRLGRLVEVRFFGGLSVEETGEALDLSPRTVKRDWAKARAFLRRELSRGSAP